MVREAENDVVSITERINGWWVTVRHDSGHEEHHGPYPDQEAAQNEAELLSAERPQLADE